MLTPSKYFKTLYRVLGDGALPGDFVETLLENMTRDVDGSSIIGLDYTQESFKRIYEGRLTISQKKITSIISRLDKVKFEEYLESFPDNIANALAEALSVHGHEFRATKKDLATSCCNLLEKILLENNVKVQNTVAAKNNQPPISTSDGNGDSVYEYLYDYYREVKGIEQSDFSTRMQRFDTDEYRAHQAEGFKHSSTDFLATLTCNDKNRYTSIKEILDDSTLTNIRLFLLQGMGGMGKTHNMLRCYNDLIRSKINVVYITARRLNLHKDIHGKSCTVPITRFIRMLETDKKNVCVERHDSCDEKITLLESGQPLVILIDGLNEAKDKKCRAIQKEVNLLLKRYKNLRIVISRRTGQADSPLFMGWSVSSMKIHPDYLAENVILRFIKNQPDAMPEPSKDMMNMLVRPLMLVLYTNTSQYIKRFSKDHGIKHFYNEPVDSLLIFNFYHVQVAKEYLKAEDKIDETIRPLVMLLGFEWILPDVAYNMLVNEAHLKHGRYVTESDLWEKYVEPAVKRINEQMKVFYLHVWKGNLPKRIEALCGIKHLDVKRKAKDQFIEPIIDGKLAQMIFHDIQDALYEDNRIGDPKVEDGNKLYGFQHSCLRNCMGALHLINSVKMPNLLVEGSNDPTMPNLYVPEVWIKHDFTQYPDILLHFAQLEKRKHGFARLKKLIGDLLEASVIGELTDKGERQAGLGTRPEHKYNFYMKNVCAVAQEFLRLFPNHEVYRQFKVESK